MVDRVDRWVGGIVLGSLAVLLVVVGLRLSDYKAFGAPVEARLTPAECHYLSRIVEYARSAYEVEASKPRFMRRLQHYLSGSSSVKGSHVDRFLWEVSSLWGTDVTPAQVYRSCMAHKGHYKEGETIDYTS